MLDRRVVAAAFVLSLAGCAPSRLGPHRSPPGVTLQVENRHWEDVRVFVDPKGAPIHLGAVKAMSTQSFRVSDSQLGSGLGIRLMAESFASRTVLVSQEVTIPAGTSVHWTIEGRLTQSFVQFRPR